MFKTNILLTAKEPFEHLDHLTESWSPDPIGNVFIQIQGIPEKLWSEKQNKILIVWKTSF